MKQVFQPPKYVCNGPSNNANVTMAQQQQNKITSRAIPTHNRGLFLGSSNISILSILEQKQDGRKRPVLSD
jgi:hypothetical protein